VPTPTVSNLTIVTDGATADAPNTPPLTPLASTSSPLTPPPLTPPSLSASTTNDVMQQILEDYNDQEIIQNQYNQPHIYDQRRNQVEKVRMTNNVYIVETFFSNLSPTFSPSPSFHQVP
jgi:hypothetical protein